jgi:N4-gp56 family major capsid protein
MAHSTIPVGDPRAVKRWSKLLAVESLTREYFGRKFIGQSDNHVIQQKSELESDAGDTISFDLSVQLRGRPVTGDQQVQGREESLRFYTDQVMIDQLRHPVSSGGRMTRKRTEHDLRMIAKDRLGEFWAQYKDQLIFIYLSGARGINEDFVELPNYTGFAGNPVQAPDSAHLVYGGSATSKATITSSDKMTRALIERVVTNVGMMRAVDPDAANMVPVNIEGEEHYVMLMSLVQENHLRNDVGAGGWLDVQKAAAAAEGSKTSRIFKGGLGMINGAILHSHKSVVRFNDYGAGGNVPAARALFMGRQAGVIAYGTTDGQRMMWKEESTDYGNQMTIVAGCIMGLKKTRFNQRDFGITAVDTYAPSLAA